MVSRTADAQTIIDKIGFLENVLKEAEVIVESVKRLQTLVHDLISELHPADAPETPADPGSPVVHDTTPGALENYDAEQLVGLRKAHAALEHAIEHCHVCQILERRLGSAKP